MRVPPVAPVADPAPMPRPRTANRVLALMTLVVLTAAWTAGAASAATSTEIDGDGLPNTYERDWTKTNASDRDMGLVNTP